MIKKRNILGNRLSENLPVHKPDQGLWDRISTELDAVQAREIYEEKLANLPVHKAGEASWAAILSRLQRSGMLRKTAYTLLAAAASLLLLFSIFRNPELKHVINNKAASSPATIKPAIPAESAAIAIIPGGSHSSVASLMPSSEISPTAQAIENPEKYREDQQANGSKENDPPLAYLPLQNTPRRDLNLLKARTDFRPSPARIRDHSVPGSPSYARVIRLQPVPKTYSPEPYNPNQKTGTGFTLAANYLPESFNNGNGTSLFHNFGLQASLGNDKIRIQSGIGMAYTSEHRVYDVNYTQFIPITGTKPGTNIDTTEIKAFDRASELEGTERHQYLTYDLGVGKKLFSIGKMTTWVNTGAGLAVKLDHTSLRETTIKTITTNTNSTVNTIDLQIPTYNGVNINIMAGLDFSYQLMSHLNISFAPTSRIYVKPVLETNGASTDSFTLGFRSGIRYDF